MSKKGFSVRYHPIINHYIFNFSLVCPSCRRRAMDNKLQNRGYDTQQLLMQYDAASGLNKTYIAITPGDRNHCNI